MFFTNGGAEANENAIRMARLHTGRHKVLAAYRSYHGATAGAIALTGDPRRWPTEPGMPGVVRFWGPYPYRSAFHADDRGRRSASGRSRTCATSSCSRAPHTIAAIILETVVGTNGILVPPDGYLAGVRALCDEYGIVMIADEVMAGFGRCGEWFAVDRWGVTPDLITFAKGVNSGYVPLGGVVISDADRGDLRATRPYPGRAHLLRPPARLRVGRRLDQRSSRRRASSSTPARSATTSSGPGCASWPSGTRRSARCAASACSGRSSWCATARPASRWCRTTPPAPAAAPMAELAAACKQRGLWPFTHFNRMHVVPPCTTTRRRGRARASPILDEALDGGRPVLHRRLTDAPAWRPGGPRSRLTAADVAAWLVKTSRPPALIEPGWSPGEERTFERCVRATYRLGLMAPGQVCLLWLSGRTCPGVHAVGTLVAGPGGEEPVDTVDAPGGPVVTVRLRLLARPGASERADDPPAFAASEVARMPAGSNPSYLTAPQLAEVLARLS